MQDSLEHSNNKLKNIKLRMKKKCTNLFIVYMLFLLTIYLY